MSTKQTLEERAACAKVYFPLNFSLNQNLL